MNEKKSSIQLKTLNVAKKFEKSSNININFNHVFSVKENLAVSHFYYQAQIQVYEALCIVNSYKLSHNGQNR